MQSDTVMGKLKNLIQNNLAVNRDESDPNNQDSDVASTLEDIKYQVHQEAAFLARTKSKDLFVPPPAQASRGKPHNPEKKPASAKAMKPLITPQAPRTSMLAESIKATQLSQTPIAPAVSQTFPAETELHRTPPDEPELHRTPPDEPAPQHEKIFTALQAKKAASSQAERAQSLSKSNKIIVPLTSQAKGELLAAIMKEKPEAKKRITADQYYDIIEKDVAVMDTIDDVIDKNRNTTAQLKAVQPEE